jgi:hypothetical protein
VWRGIGGGSSRPFGGPLLIGAARVLNRIVRSGLASERGRREGEARNSSEGETDAAERSGAAAAQLPDGRVVVGVTTGPVAPRGSAEVYDPTAGAFGAIGAMENDFNALASAELYRP